eukprot:gene23525-28191_t
MRIAAAVIGFLTIAAVSGCSASSDSPEDKTDPSGRVFISTSVDGTQIPGGGPLTLDFSQAGRVSASAGCNTANGSVEFTDGTLTTGTMASTMMGCPPGIAESDSWTTTLLTAAPAWSLDGDTLVLTSKDATVTLQDKKIVTPDRPLQGTTWTVTSLISPDAISTSLALETSAPELTIAADGSVSGITFTPMATTRMACPEENMDIERQILAVLDGEVSYTVDADTLTLRKPDDTGLILTAQQPAPQFAGAGIDHRGPVQGRVVRVIADMFDESAGSTRSLCGECDGKPLH